ncbi:uncharacterized protein LOC107876677 [Capsicum annuum]|uniref:uncharacterized protein LOC107876677 n=1 Tax=Capsicum annuum TaxID=4072 RepID=UPI0007BF4CA0|nr:uncharacterized protein LOC107876677 [Capsicum annuum]
MVVVGADGGIGSCQRGLGLGAASSGGEERRAGVGVGSRAGVKAGAVCGGRGRRQETKWVGTKARDVDGFKLWYSGSERRHNGVGILVDEDLRGQVVEVKRWYAPQVRLGEEVKESFWEALDEVVRSMPSSKKIVIAEDFNGHIGVSHGGYNEVHEGFGFSERNGEGVALLDFSRAFGFVVVNSSFPKKEDHLITFQRASAKTQIDFLLLRKGDRVLCKDCKVISSEHLSTQHRLLVMDLCIRKSKKSRAGEG